jgi:Cdc6-like AAA superfamily ATPase
MIKLRLGENISLVDEKAITFASRKIAKNKGDAREALQIMSDAISNAVKSIAPESLSKETDDSSCVVKISHVMKAIKGNDKSSLVKTIAELPQNAKIVLCVATALGQVGSRWEILSLSQLKKYCDEAYGNDLIKAWSLEHFNNILEQLRDADLISSYETEDEFSEDRCIKVGVQLEDVELAIEDTLLKENNFYSMMVEYVRKENINQR